jgi:adenosylmethionine-8-amino-7-oxononanoate aminotransferase
MVPSYTGNALACAAANASLELFEMENAEKADGKLLQ